MDGRERKSRTAARRASGGANGEDLGLAVGGSSGAGGRLSVVGSPFVRSNSRQVSLRWPALALAFSIANPRHSRRRFDYKTKK
jgi:hypothetical protein